MQFIIVCDLKKTGSIMVLKNVFKSLKSRQIDNHLFKNVYISIISPVEVPFKLLETKSDQISDAFVYTTPSKIYFYTRSGSRQ